MNQNSGNSNHLESGSTSQASKASNASIASKASSPFMPQDNLQHSDPLPSKKVLIITYYWPPSAGAGVQRWLKFAKYLPSSGWEPLIITVDPEYATYPAIDHSLDRDLDSKIRIWKTRATDYFRIYRRDKSKVPAAGFASSDEKSFKGWLIRFVRGNFFIPDPRRGWNKYAFKQAGELILSEGVTHVITTSPPHSTQLIGIKLKKKFPSIKWIADLRDPWTDIYYYDKFFPTFIARIIDRSYEESVLEKADRIITVGNSLRNVFSNKVPAAKDKISVLTNGYDEDDFRNIQKSQSSEFTITYTGTLSSDYPLNGILSTLQTLCSEGIEIRLRFIGSVAAEQTRLIYSKIDSKLVEFIKTVDHHLAIKYMFDSDVLLLIIPDHTSRNSIITGKLFEYLATRNPILCLGPVDGDAADIIKNTGSGVCINYDDEISIRRFITSVKSQNFKTSDIKPTEYSRENLSRKLASLLY